MQDTIFTNSYFLNLLAIELLAAVICFYALNRLRFAKNGFLRRIFHVPARKSQTNAVLLGGLIISVLAMAAALSMVYFPQFEQYFSGYEPKLVKAWALGSSILVLYGFLDDRYELRAVVKLVMQILTVFFFSFFASRILGPERAHLAFVVLCFWGLGVLNGANLLDGLDTMLLKISVPTFLYYIGVGLYYKSSLLMGMAVFAMIPMIMFYFYNKVPAKIHLGEIGGSFLGLTFLLLSAITFRMANHHHYYGNAIALALIPLNFAMVEVGISFLRRIYSKKSPFKGDKKHLHHILVLQKHYSISSVSSILGGLNGMTLAFTIMVSLYSNWVVGFFVNVSLLTLFQILVGRPYWAKEKGISLKPQDLFNYLRKDHVRLIETQMTDDFQFTILDAPNESNVFDDESLIKKKDSA